jgi:hypothetical protein
MKTRRKISSIRFAYQMENNMTSLDFSLATALSFANHVDSILSTNYTLDLGKDESAVKEVLQCLETTTQGVASEWDADGHKRKIGHILAFLYDIPTRYKVSTSSDYVSCRDFERNCTCYAPECCGCCRIPRRWKEKFCISTSYREKVFLVPHSEKIGLIFLPKEKKEKLSKRQKRNQRLLEIWKVDKLLWIAQKKESKEYCALASVPSDVIRVIIGFIRS